MSTAQTDSEPSGQALPTGTRLVEFVIERVLGSGGFGITYLARDTSLNRQVVIKENLPAQFAWRETTTGTVRPRHTSGGDADDYKWSMNNFLREADTLASLDHPGIVRVLRKFEANGTAYFVMPFVEGVAFDTLIEDRRAKGQPFSDEELKGLLEGLLDALRYLHDRGIYHRDIKPGNILISNQGVPALIDFGSARQRLSERSMTVVESAGYTPFEQLQSRGNVGPWSDLYALGATLVKAITFETLPKAADRMMGDPWQGLVKQLGARSRHSFELLDSIDRAVQVIPENRWQEAGQWRDGLRKEVRHSTPPLPPHTTAIVPAPVIPATVDFQTAGARERPEDSKVAEPKARKTNTHLNEIVRTAMGVAVGLVGLFFMIWLVIHSISRSGSSNKGDPSNKSSVQIQVESPAPFLADHSDPSTWLKMAEAGDPLAQALLARAYFCGMDGKPSSYGDAAEWAKKSAAQNHPLGLFMHGRIVERDITLPKEMREEKANRCYQNAVNEGFLTNVVQGGRQWLAILGNAYLFGNGVSKNGTEAATLLRRAADMGDAMAMANVGTCYDYGIGVAKDEPEAVKWYRKAADAGNPYGMYLLGAALESGSGVTKNETFAAQWYRKAAEIGDSDGMWMLGNCLQSGTGIQKNEKNAVEWYRKSAELGNPEGMWRLGELYRLGTGMTMNATEAAKWYQKSADAGNSVGMCLLGKCYQYGVGLAVDAKESARCYQKSADGGNLESMNLLGYCYQYGTGIAKELTVAVKWYRKAAEMGQLDAMNNLANCYYNGDGVIKNGAEAAKWYRAAADQGHSLAQNNLGICYQYGTGVTKELAEAVKWFRKAADMGQLDAMGNLGNCYYNGVGVAKDAAEAARWYQAAADQGQPSSQNMLGVCYQYGMGKTKDLAEAGKWYRKAALQGNAEATKNLESLATPPDRLQVDNVKKPNHGAGNENRADYEVAEKVPGKIGFVFSPYTKGVVDVRDIPRGTLVQDPTYTGNGKGFFRVP